MSEVAESANIHQSTAWVYEGIWGFLTQIFCVPRKAPELPIQANESIVSRKPSPAFIRYSLCWTLVGLTIGGVVLIGGSIILAITQDPLFLIATLGLAVLFVLVFMIAYLTIYLRYDTMWYVFSDRSMRLRRGIWLIRESTITFENVQNVKVTQGPLQRIFGIADVVVETAGGGGAAAEAGGGLTMHSGVIEGVADASKIRDLIMSRARMSKTTGLGDEESESNDSQWSPRHIAVLREIRDLAARATG